MLWTGLAQRGQRDSFLKVIFYGNESHAKDILLQYMCFEAMRMRLPGVEPGAQAWEACVLPLHYRRSCSTAKDKGHALLLPSCWAYRHIGRVASTNFQVGS